MKEGKKGEGKGEVRGRKCARQTAIVSHPVGRVARRLLQYQRNGRIAVVFLLPPTNHEPLQEAVSVCLFVLAACLCLSLF